MTPTRSMRRAPSLSLDDAAGSSDMISRYLDKKPADSEGWYLLAAADERQKKYTQALAAYDKIIALDPSQGDAWFGETRFLLTVVEDAQRGLDTLAKALAGRVQRSQGSPGAARLTLGFWSGTRSRLR